MPTVKPISDLQRNLGAIAEECHETRSPIYLTKNGNASLVVMDAEAFDEQFSSAANLREYEMRVYRSIARGYDDLVNGRVRPWSQAKVDAERIREARNAS